MRILFSSFDEVPSFKGAATHILGGLCEVIKTHQVNLITLGTQTIPSALNLNHLPVNIPEPNYFLRGQLFRKFITQWLATHRVDMIHFRTPWEGLPAIRSGVPCIYEVNGVPSVELKYYYPTISTTVLAMFHHWELQCVQQAAAVLVPSVRNKEFIIKTYGVDPSKVWVFPNARGIITSALPGGDSDTGFLRGVYIGTLSPWQGVQWAVKAFKDMADRFTLDIFTPTTGAPLRKLVRRLQRLGLDRSIQLHPAKPMSLLRPELSRYDFALTPLLKTARNTVQGCCPIKTLDYLCAGLPSVASDIEVNRTWIEHGTTGLLFEPNRLSSLQCTLEDLWASRQSLPQVKQACLQQAQRIWSWHEYSQKLSDFYRELRASVRQLPPDIASAQVPN
jgi:glycosyltransferase involved in cell wall biosynthesis